MIGDSPELVCQCFDDVRAGKTTADSCFARYPEMAAELAGLLQVANAIAPTPRIEPDSIFRVRARAALLNTIVAERAQRVSPLRRLWTFLVGDSAPSRRAEMPVSLFLALAIVVGGSSAGVAIAAQDAMPGEPLYPVKSFGEIVQVTLAPSDDYRTALHLTYASRRLDEMEQLQGRKQTALLEQTTKRYTDHLDEAIRLSANRPTSGTVSELVQRISKREQVLAQLSHDVPRPAMVALATAIVRTDVLADSTARSNKAGGSAPAAVAAPHPSPSSSVAPSASATAVTDVATDIHRLSARVANIQVAAAPAAASETPAAEELIIDIAEASGAVEHGKPEVAATKLHAFANKLNAMQRSGRISQDDYNTLYNSYADTAVKLGSTAVPTAATGKPNAPSSPTSSKSAATPQPTSTPVPTAAATIVSTPTAVSTLAPTPPAAGTAGTAATPEKKPTPKGRQDSE